MPWGCGLPVGSLTATARRVRDCERRDFKQHTKLAPPGGLMSEAMMLRLSDGGAEVGGEVRGLLASPRGKRRRL